MPRLRRHAHFVRSANRVHRYKDEDATDKEGGGAEQVWRYRLLQCYGCGMGFVDPMPDPKVLASFYAREYGSYQVQDDDGGSISRSKQVTAQLRMRGTLSPAGASAGLSRAAGWAIETLSGRTVPATLGVPLQLPKDAAILDLGYGSGDWLISMHQLGYIQLHGFDIDANDAHVERLRKLGVQLSSGDFMVNDYPEHTLDCIRLSHVIEHLVDPVAVLRKCARMLKPGGIIALSHPSFRSWLARIGFEHTLTVQLPLHLYHHTPRSTALLLRKAGITPVQSKHYGVPHMFSDTLNKILKARGTRRPPGALYAAVSPLYAAFCRVTGKGDFISAYGRTER